VSRIKKQMAQLQKRDRNLKQMQEEAGTPEEFSECRTKRNPIRGELANLELELRESQKVVALPSLSALEQRLETITTGAEPKTYEERRPVLEALVDLRMEYLDGELTIEGKVPVSEASEAGKNCHSGVGADSQGNRENHHQAEHRRLEQAANGEAESIHTGIYAASCRK
jgi:hypothetical protein